jgi:alpha-beta hydrolase superfamily lysophospholipase
MSKGDKMSKQKKEPLAWVKGLPFEDETYLFQFVRTLGAAYNGGADLIECLETAARITEGDVESWYREWLETAERLHGIADRAVAAGRMVSAKEASLRASNYYRTAEFFLHADPTDERHLSASRLSRDCFVEAMKQFPFDAAAVEIPYEGTHLPGYFYRSPQAKGKAPLFIVHSGFDGNAEELYFTTGPQALNRGYHCLFFDGPGQGMALREKGLYFRPDWENVITPVVDFAIQQPGVDENRIALQGISQGGYLAPRALAFEHRIKAGIANGAMWSLAQPVKEAMGPAMIDLLETDPEKFEEAFEPLMAVPKIKWFFEDSRWKYNVSSTAEFFKNMEAYTMEGIAEKIQCPMLITGAEGDLFMSGQAKLLYDALTCPKTFIEFTAEDAAETHCQCGALALGSQRILDWLDEVFE